MRCPPACGSENPMPSLLSTVSVLSLQMRPIISAGRLQAGKMWRQVFGNHWRIACIDLSATSWPKSNGESCSVRGQTCERRVDISNEEIMQIRLS